MSQPSFAWPTVADALESFAGSTSPAQCCQAAFVLAACAVLGLALMPPQARALLMDYGARSARQEGNADADADAGAGIPQTGAGPDEDDGGNLPPRASLWLRSVATLTAWGQVPHAWFGSFYLVSLAGSTFWLAQYLAGGAVMRFFMQWQSTARAPSMTLTQAAISWTMVVLQAGRRFYEHTVLARPSTSTMWVAHWLLGIFFYTGLSMAAWIDASGTARSALSLRIARNLGHCADTS